MYKIVLVPLDGSMNAECTLSNVKSLAKEGSVGEVILFNDAEINFPLSAIHPDDIIHGNDYDFQAFRQAVLDKAHSYLEKLESKRIGAQQAKRQAHEVMRLALSSQVNDEITAREVEIAAMKGLSLIAGEPLTDEVRARIRNTPALPFFQTV